MYSSFPPVDALIAQVKKFDYQKFGSDVVYYTATFCAIVVGVTSYLWTALQLWWNDNGESVQVNFIRFVVNVIDCIASVCIVTPKVYRWVKLNTNRMIDFIYLQAAFA